MRLYVQAGLSGILTAGLYALITMGLTLSWGFLKIINLAHFAVVLVAAYATYQLSVLGIDPLLATLITVPLGFGAGYAMQWLFERFAVSEFNSLLVSFGLLIASVQIVTNVWSADFRRLTSEENPYGLESVTAGGFAAQIPLLLALVCAIGIGIGLRRVLRQTFIGTALAAMAEDRDVAAIFGVDAVRLGRQVAGVGGAIGALAGSFVAISGVIFPSLAVEWFAIGFTVVILGGIGNVSGVLPAALLIAVTSALASVVWSPTVAPLVTFLMLIGVLVARPEGLFEWTRS